MCAVNASEGRDPGVLDALRAAAGRVLLDLHADRDHHRCVLTLGGAAGALVDAVRSLGEVAIARIDLRAHDGVHPRIGALDVVPFAPPRDGPLDRAVEAREEAMGALGELGLPCFRYGPLPGGAVRTLPEVRKGAFVDFLPDAGPIVAHRTAGAVAVGARPPLVAWNAWLRGATLKEARALASAVRSEHVRALGFPVQGGTQVSCNLVAPALVTPLDVYEQLAAALPVGARIERCELVGLVPEAVLAAVPAARWTTLGLAADRGVEHVLAARGLAVG